MSYLIGQIIICLLIAFLFGLLIGWLLKSISCKGKLRELEDKFAKKGNVKTELEVPVVKITGPGEYEVVVDDDLKEISGVGPKLEKMLNENGVRSFQQIAELSSSDIQELSTKLGSFKDRIVREDWVFKAKDLHYKKYGKKL